jgi:hypothetical protein
MRTSKFDASTEVQEWSDELASSRLIVDPGLKRLISENNIWKNLRGPERLCRGNFLRLYLVFGRCVTEFLTTIKNSFPSPDPKIQRIPGSSSFTSAAFNLLNETRLGSTPHVKYIRHRKIIPESAPGQELSIIKVTANQKSTIECQQQSKDYLGPGIFTRKVKLLVRGS